ncbi:MAG: hypothetical protein ABSA09_01770 [Desulfobaccales bacterium]|jgi:hypothetical protein
MKKAATTVTADRFALGLVSAGPGANRPGPGETGGEDGNLRGPDPGGGLAEVAEPEAAKSGERGAPRRREARRSQEKDQEGRPGRSG